MLITGTTETVTVFEVTEVAPVALTTNRNFHPCTASVRLRVPTYSLFPFRAAVAVPPWDVDHVVPPSVLFSQE